MRSRRLSFAPGGNCGKCQGTGKEVRKRGRGGVVIQRITPCPLCDGRGLVIDNPFRFLGVTGINVVTRISGILLAALAVQFVAGGAIQIWRSAI